MNKLCTFFSKFRCKNINIYKYFWETEEVPDTNISLVIVTI
jgi:hypothetical protein